MRMGYSDACGGSFWSVFWKLLRSSGRGPTQMQGESVQASPGDPSPDTLYRMASGFDRYKKQIADILRP